MRENIPVEALMEPRPSEFLLNESKKAIKMMDVEKAFNIVSQVVDWCLFQDNLIHYHAAGLEPQKAETLLKKWETSLDANMRRLSKELDQIEKTAKTAEAFRYRNSKLTRKALEECRKKVEMTLHALEELPA